MKVVMFFAHAVFWLLLKYYREGPSGLDGTDFSAGPQTSPVSPLWSPQPALCTLLLTWHKLGGRGEGIQHLRLWFLPLLLLL